MKTHMLILTLALTLAASARADVIATGLVSASTPNGAPCSMSGSAPLSCTSNGSGNALAESTIAANLGAENGSISATAGVFQGTNATFGNAQAYIHLSLNETYVLTGGSGLTTLYFAVNDYATPGGAGNPFCQFTFNGGMAQGCSYGQTFIEQVSYGDPFTVELEASLTLIGYVGQPATGSLIYNFDPPGLDVVTPNDPIGIAPEPTSLAMLLTAVGIGYAKLRMGIR